MDYQAIRQARKFAADQLIAAFPHLVPVNGACSCVTAAKNIRIELKRAFPGVKFSVKTSKFAGGDSIRVGWIDGPTTSQVDAIIGKYTGGHFDGMTDSYNYRTDYAWTDAFGDAKYTSADRDYSDHAIDSCIRTLFNRYPGNFKDVIRPTAEQYRRGKLWSAVIPGFQEGMQTYIYRELAKRTWCLTVTA